MCKARGLPPGSLATSLIVYSEDCLGFSGLEVLGWWISGVLDERAWCVYGALMWFERVPYGRRS